MLREEHAFTNARAAQPQNWYTFSSGTAGFGYSASFSHQGLRVELYIDRGDRNATKAAFDKLHLDREAIEASFGSPLSWERLESRRASRVAAYRDVTIDASEEALDEARRWAVNGLLRFKQVFGPRLASLIDE
jgi:hypothetical protein